MSTPPPTATPDPFGMNDTSPILRVHGVVSEQAIAPSLVSPIGSATTTVPSATNSWRAKGSNTSTAAQAVQIASEARKATLLVAARDRVVRSAWLSFNSFCAIDFKALRII
ncbi:MAG TPA: hypothetical protein PLS46_01930 [Microthrixaceae bacterium]|nr:hypothetical protein [Microthrixaceae bacterium]